MLQQSPLTTIVKYAVVLVAWGITTWIRRSEKRCSLRCDPCTLCYPQYVVVFYTVGAILFLFMLIVQVLTLTVVVPQLGLFEQRLFAAALCVATIPMSASIVVASLFILVSYCNESFELTSIGINYKTAFNRCGRLNWREVTRVQAKFGWFRVNTVYNDVLWVSYDLCHISTFAAAVLNDVEPSAIDVRTERQLRRIAKEQQPPSAI